MEKAGDETGPEEGNGQGKRIETDLGLNKREEETGHVTGAQEPVIGIPTATGAALYVMIISAGDASETTAGAL
jgi:hypothetical protein